MYFEKRTSGFWMSDFENTCTTKEANLTQVPEELKENQQVCKNTALDPVIGNVKTLPCWVKITSEQFAGGVHTYVPWISSHPTASSTYSPFHRQYRACSRYWMQKMRLSRQPRTQTTRSGYTATGGSQWAIHTNLTAKHIMSIKRVEGVS